ncbi:MAG: penicillin-binding protein [Candidatus Omnitrophica bacterium]|nr:penicillin-binding protein [Candidatus Omnitrophota bacterium]
MPIHLNSDRRFLRYYIVIIFISILFIPIFLRLYNLQIKRANELKDLAEKQHNLLIDIPPERGHIYDRNQTILATSLKVPSVYAVPRMIENKREVARELAEILELDSRDIFERLDRDKAFIWLKRRVSNAVADKIKALNNPHVSVLFENKRFYPTGTSMSNIIGFCDVDEQGIDGLELHMNKYLSGKQGYKLTKRDAMGREIVALEEKLIQAVDGYNLVLNIDEFIQYTAERELRKALDKWHAKGASCVVMNPHTGEVLAMVSLPNFDPNTMKESPVEARRNRAITDYYEPGSIFKIVTAAAALNEGLFNEEDKIFCENGEYNFTRSRVLHDVHGYGWLTFSEAVEKSSNIGLCKIGQKLGVDLLYYYIKKFGFGDISGIDFPGEVEGTVRPVAQWSGYSITSIPMGQEVTVTALQMAQAMSVIANGGYLMRPYIVSQITDKKGVTIKKFKPMVMRQVLSTETAEKMRHILERVITDGTGKSAQIKNVRVGGKTGTAQKILPTGGYSHSNFIGSFVGFAPVDDPFFVVNVMIDDPHPAYYGGTVAAPVFREIISELLFHMKYIDPTKEIAA